jgi:hypothetical protein
MVDHINLSSNYIMGAQVAYQLLGKETNHVYMGGNVLDRLQQEFAVANSATPILRTNPSPLKP